MRVTRIFTASKDGWKPEDFHRHCDGRGPTLCLIRSSDNYLGAGFTSISWSSPKESECNEGEDGVDVEDPSAMVFALTNDPQVFKTKNPEQAVYHTRNSGPCW